MKKFLSIALALLMVCVMLPVVSLADEPSGSSGSIQGAIINHAPAAVSVELEKVTFTKSVAVKLYSGDTLLTIATLGGLKPGSYGFLTCCIATETADEYWALTPWTPKDDVVPDKVVLFVDGNKKAEKTFELNADEWAALPGTALPSTIVIITPSADTPKTDNQKNPSTGANDMVAAAVALMAVSALGAAVLTRKK